MSIFLSWYFCLFFGFSGDIAQLVEHRNRTAGVGGSSPLISTNIPIVSSGEMMFQHFIGSVVPDANNNR